VTEIEDDVESGCIGSIETLDVGVSILVVDVRLSVTEDEAVETGFEMSEVDDLESEGAFSFLSTSSACVPHFKICKTREGFD